MQRLKAFRIFFSLTALLFVAKPFIGFGVFNQRVQPRISHTILVKSFTKRKPESLQDADARAEWVHQLLSDPLWVLFSGIVLLLTFLFPLVFGYPSKITRRSLAVIHTGLLPPEHAYLLTGKLII